MCFHSEGIPELRASIAEFHARHDGLVFNPDNIIVGPGSKELIYLAMMVFSGGKDVWSQYQIEITIYYRYLLKITLFLFLSIFLSGDEPLKLFGWQRMEKKIRFVLTTWDSLIWCSVAQRDRASLPELTWKMINKLTWKISFSISFTANTMKIRRSVW